MAQLFVCDICGRTDKPNKDIKTCKKLAGTEFRKRNKDLFDDRPLMITIPNHEGDNYTVFVDVKIEDSRDTKKIDEFYNNKHAIIDGFMATLFNNQAGPEEGEDIPQGPQGQPQQNQDMAITMGFNNPHPKICAYCKREMLKLARTYGDEDNPTDFLK